MASPWPKCSPWAHRGGASSAGSTLRLRNSRASRTETLSMAGLLSSMLAGPPCRAAVGAGSSSQLSTPTLDNNKPCARIKRTAVHANGSHGRTQGERGALRGNFIGSNGFPTRCPRFAVVRAYTYPDAQKPKDGALMPSNADSPASTSRSSTSWTATSRAAAPRSTTCRTPRPSCTTRWWPPPSCRAVQPQNLRGYEAHGRDEPPHPLQGHRALPG